MKNRMKLITNACVGLVWIAFAAAGSAGTAAPEHLSGTNPPGPTDQTEGRAIMEKAREASQIKGMEAVSTLYIYDAKGHERVRQTSMASKEFDGGATEKRIIRFLSPAEVRGTGMLIFDYRDRNDDMWIYMPALKKTRRIVSTEKSRSFMGSEFSNADMSAPTLDDFKFSVLRSEKVDGTDCWVIEAVPVSSAIISETGYDRKISWIGKSDFVIRKAEYYNQDNEVFKRLTASDVRKIDPSGTKYMAMRMEMVNEENGRHSVMTIDKIRYDTGVKDDYFTIAYLEKLQ
jgi:outer membrane lipoprotein-sorting protein